MIDALEIRVRGIVQGVGFRPFVYRLAKRYLVNGWVLNDRDGVFIHAEAESRLLDEFVMEIADNAPPAAKVSEIELAEVPLLECSGFEIRQSEQEETDEMTLVPADLGICDECLSELHDPDDRRYHYPFINCTNCGPRFTIIDSLPYDRPATSMKAFEMCPDCSREYADPADRRFHAQPDACFECGPRLSWTPLTDGVRHIDSQASDRTARDRSDAMIAAAVDVLASGGIVAIKGLGGYHLACDASNPQALCELRRRKRRDGRAFAVMVETADDVRAFCDVSPSEESQLQSTARPIVLLNKRPDASLAEGLCDGLPELGVMLPATPVQSLIMRGFRDATGKAMLVMTSGNVHDEPIVIDDAEALAKFSGIADAILGNNRPILSRYDDSVVRVLSLGDADAVQFIRRARGYAPVPIAFPHCEEGDPAPKDAVVFAAGSEQKNTFAFLRAEEAFVSQHVGDMEDADVEDAWFEAKGRMEHLFDLSATLLACDMHPDYLASKWARGLSRESGVPLVEVQHHHAHIASVLGEHNLHGPAAGFAFDGTGYGPDGAIWGGEVLLANQSDYERFANFSYLPMPGGVAAVKYPLRMAYGMLWAFDLLDHPGASGVLRLLGDQAAVCEQMIEQGINTPYTSSVGRLFDAVSALLGICTDPSYEGESAIMLDAARLGQAGDNATFDERYAVSITKNAATDASTAHDTSVVVIDAEPVIRAVLDDLVQDVPAGVIAGRFHEAIVDAIVQVAQLVRAMYGIGLVALSGGCFMNRYLVERSVRLLGEAGFTVALNGSLPPNDGCISYGQAVIASASR